jgi:hypothetical protein
MELRPKTKEPILKVFRIPNIVSSILSDLAKISSLE